MAVIVQDISKAFDSVARRAGKELSLRRLGVPERIMDKGGRPLGPSLFPFPLFFGDGACTGTSFSIDHPPFLLRFHLSLIRDAAPRPCHRGDVPDALAG